MSNSVRRSRVLPKVRKVSELYEEDGVGRVLDRVARLVFRGRSGDAIRSIIGKRLHQKFLMCFRLGYWPQIRNPRTFNEKLMYRKLYTDDPRFARVEDKWAVREYVAQRVDETILPKAYHVTGDPGPSLSIHFPTPT